MKKYAIYWLALAVVVITGCQKEVSFELGGIPAEGTLQSEVSGDCLPKTVNGVYEEGVALAPNTNTITVDINVTKTGTYTITTDTVNGYFFRGTGRFTTIGVNTVILQSQGTPFAQGINNFVVKFLDEVCDVQVQVLPAGAGGPAVFTLVNGGTPANCATAVVNGTYVQNAAVNSSNSVDVTVSVTTIGTYTITATGGGLTFTRTAAFTTTGNQTIRLNASGTAATAGANTITFAAPFASCSFTVNVTAPAAFTINCAGATVNGIYQIGTALNPATNTVVLPITVTSAGAYSITTTINGMTFSGSGSVVLTPTPTASITLTGTGTPSGTAGTVAVPVTFGASNCSFDVPVVAGAIVDWQFTEGASSLQGAFTNGDLQVISVPPLSLTSFTYRGTTASGQNIVMILADLAGGITNGETYGTTSTTTNNVGFLVSDISGVIYEANASIAGLTFRVTVSSHNTTTKTITGTFNGTVKDGAGNTKTITAGSFTGTYP